MKIEPEELCDGVVLYEGDCLEVLPHLTGIDAVVTDPPYGIAASKKGAHSSIRDNTRWEAKTWDDSRTVEAVRLAVSAGKYAMVWGGNYYTDVLPPSSAWFAWVKPEAETGFSLADMEMCWSNLTTAARVKHYRRRDGNLHPTQKPIEVIRWCIRQLPPGVEIILDPFAGSGTTAVAALREGRRCILIEKDAAYCEIIRKRVRAAAGIGSLFDPSLLGDNDG